MDPDLGQETVLDPDPGQETVLDPDPGFEKGSLGWVDGCTVSNVIMFGLAGGTGKYH